LVEGEEVESLGMRKRERWEVNPTMQRAESAWWDLPLGSGSCEKDSPIEIIAVEKQEQTGGRSMTTDLENERVMRTKRASR
jgi:hypothetical protein